MARARVLSRSLEDGINALVRHGIRFSIEKGEIFIRWEDWKKYNRLCEEGKLPPSVC